MEFLGEPFSLRYLLRVFVRKKKKERVSPYTSSQRKKKKEYIVT